MAIVEFDLPKITSGIQNGLSGKQVSGYLYQLTEQLTYILNNLETENFTEDTQQLFIRTQKAAEQTVRQLDIVEQVTGKTKRELIAEIVRTAEEVKRSVEILIGQTQEGIFTQVEEHYTAKAQSMALEERLLSLLEQTSRDITMRFDEANTYTIEVDGALQSFIDEVRTNIRFSVDGIELGQLNSPFMAKLDNTKLSFTQNGVESAYMSNNKMYITEAAVPGTGTLGQGAQGYYDFVLEPNNSLSLVRRS